MQIYFDVTFLIKFYVQAALKIKHVAIHANRTQVNNVISSENFNNIVSKHAV